MRGVVDGPRRRNMNRQLAAYQSDVYSNVKPSLKALPCTAFLWCPKPHTRFEHLFVWFCYIVIVLDYNRCVRSEKSTRAPSSGRRLIHIFTTTFRDYRRARARRVFREQIINHTMGVYVCRLTQSMSGCACWMIARSGQMREEWWWWSVECSLEMHRNGARG